MAMTCKNMARECDGCMACIDEAKPALRCDECDGMIYEGDNYYVIEDDYCVCEDCMASHRRIA